jgi:hypothetical protein
MPEVGGSMILRDVTTRCHNLEDFTPRSRCCDNFKCSNDIMMIFTVKWKAEELSLCLISAAPRYEDIRGNEGIAGGENQVHTPAALTQGKSSRYPLDRGLDVPQSSVCCGQGKFYWGNVIWIVQLIAVSVPSELSRLLMIIIIITPWPESAIKLYRRSDHTYG